MADYDKSQIPVNFYENDSSQINASLEHIKQMMEQEKKEPLKGRPITENEKKLNELNKLAENAPKVSGKDYLQHSENDTATQKRLIDKERTLVQAETLKKQNESDPVKRNDPLTTRIKAIEEKAIETLKNTKESPIKADDKVANPALTKKEQLKAELDALVTKKKASEKPEDKANLSAARADKQNDITRVKYGKDDDKEDLDDKFKNRYVLDQNNNYRWSFNQKIRAFQDKGSKIIVYGKPASVSEDIVKLLKSQGVTKIKVNGTQEHKQRIWVEATEKGIEVSGYKPTKDELKHIESLKNTVTVLKKETEPKLSKDDKKILESHREVANKAADKYLNRANKALFVKTIMNEVAKQMQSGKDVPKVKVADKEFQAER